MRELLLALTELYLLFVEKKPVSLLTKNNLCIQNCGLILSFLLHMLPLHSFEKACIEQSLFVSDLV